MALMSSEGYFGDIFWLYSNLVVFRMQVNLEKQVESHNSSISTSTTGIGLYH